MPYCPRCKSEFPLVEAEECPECGRLLLPEAPVWRTYDPEEPLVAVATVYSEFEAHLLQGQLEQEGIPVLIQPKEAGAVLGLMIDGWGEHRILVPESLAEEAAEILAAYEE